jgi:hypothetical protein
MAACYLIRHLSYGVAAALEKAGPPAYEAMVENVRRYSAWVKRLR